jgi:hypothetical protein
MKRVILFLIVALTPTVSWSAEPIRNPLKDVKLDLKSLGSEQTRQYKWISVTRKGTKTESNDYATLKLSTKVEKDKVELHDTITLVPAHGRMIFDRKLSYLKSNFFTPEQITLDITGPQNTVRQLSYKSSEAKIVEFSGAKTTERWTFDNGILTFNALLRIAPLLPRDLGQAYTFQNYAESFLFRIHEAERNDPPFQLICEARETITIGKKLHPCARFRLDLRSADVRTDFWIGENNLVVKFVDTLGEGADMKLLEATLEE